eukprot:TRINITY_DN15337_c0_g1_i2.p1 TRINITY_DN15337_c0_g1~~TRINITY_DN15337_c0_g1_i2.p1  ORF type:complete len:166 (-),score=21.74 TRINITY_DN15337_c0_g1_i2:341-838(-)
MAALVQRSWEYLMAVGTTASYTSTVVVMSLTGAFLAGPFKTIGPVFAVDVAGKDAKGTALSIIGMGSNVMAVAMIFLKGAIGKDWSRLFGCLAAMSVVALLFAVYIWMRDLGIERRKTVMQEPLVAPAAAADEEEDDDDADLPVTKHVSVLRLRTYSTAMEESTH